MICADCATAADDLTEATEAVEAMTPNKARSVWNNALAIAMARHTRCRGCACQHKTPPRRRP